MVSFQAAFSPGALSASPSSFLLLAGFISLQIYVEIHSFLLDIDRSQQPEPPTGPASWSHPLSAGKLASLRSACTMSHPLNLLLQKGQALL